MFGLEKETQSIPLITKDTTFEDWFKYEASLGNHMFPGSIGCLEAWEDIQKRVLEHGFVDINPPPTPVTADTTFEEWLNSENKAGRPMLAWSQHAVDAWDKVQKELKDGQINDQSRKNKM